MNNLLKSSIVILIASASGMLWAIPYRQDHPMAAVGGFFGYTDSTYALAGWVAGLGALAFLIGIGLLIGGLVSSSQAAQTGPLSQSGDGDLSAQPASFDRAKWNALLQFDKDIAAAAEQVRSFGEIWVEELGAAFFALNDKTYLPEIVNKIEQRARSEAEETKKLRAAAESERLEYEKEQMRLSQIRREKLQSFCNCSGSGLRWKSASN